MPSHLSICHRPLFLALVAPHFLRGKCTGLPPAAAAVLTKEVSTVPCPPATVVCRRAQPPPVPTRPRKTVAGGRRLHERGRGDGRGGCCRGHDRAGGEGRKGATATGARLCPRKTRSRPKPRPRRTRSRPRARRLPPASCGDGSNLSLGPRGRRLLPSSWSGRQRRTLSLQNAGARVLGCLLAKERFAGRWGGPLGPPPPRSRARFPSPPRGDTRTTTHPPRAAPPPRPLVAIWARDRPARGRLSRPGPSTPTRPIAAVPLRRPLGRRC